VAFGGHDLRTAYVGSIEMDRIASFRSPVPGAPMYHWHASE
jgi:gluconolactonase